MNHEVRALLADADRALRENNPAAAYDHFVEAGDVAAGLQLWRSAVRCYRRGVELDLFDGRAVGRLARVAPRAGAGTEWAEYVTVLAGRPPWPRFDCRIAQLVIGDGGAVVTCTPVGTVLEVLMTADDRIEVHPDARLASMPLAMALVVLRRAMWTAPRDDAPVPMSLDVIYAGRSPMRLDEVGDWTAA